MPDRRLVILILSVGITAVLVYLAYDNRPMSHSAAWSNFEIIPENKTQYFKYKAVEDGKEVERDGMATYTVTKPVYRVSDKQQGPTAEDKLRFVCLCLVALGFGLYSSAVLGLWLRDKITKQPATVNEKDTSERLNRLVVFATGALAGFIANGKTNVPQELELQALRTELSQVKEVATHAMQIPRMTIKGPFDQTLNLHPDDFLPPNPSSRPTPVDEPEERLKPIPNPE